MNWKFMLFIAVGVAKIASGDIQNKIKAYFSSEAETSFERKWKPYQTVFQNTISYTLQQAFGHISLNLYINRLLNPLAISTGYYHSDNQVKLIFQNMELDELPHLYNAKVNFPLDANVLSLEASVSKIIVHASYLLFRNKSDIIFSVADQDPYKSSPFRFQQVRTSGDLAITITGCSLSGVVLATLSGRTVNLGHHHFKLNDCQYSLEIYTLGTGAPPVIANYLPNGEKGSNLEVLLLRPILEELMPKLQSSMFSDVNTSAILADELPKIREKQEHIFEETKDHVDKIVREMNKNSIDKNMGTISLDDFTLAWDDPFVDLPDAKVVKLTKMVLMGLDTVYSSHSGGPIRLTETEIKEQLRFSTLEVMGTITADENYDFAVEISDYAVDVTLDSNLKAKFEVLGWRFVEFSCSESDFLTAEPLVVGYLLSELPKHIMSHLYLIYNDGTSGLDLPLNDDDAGEKNEHAKKVHKQVQQHDVQNAPHEEEQGRIKLNYVQAKSDVEDEVVKLHDVQVAPHLEEGPVKIHYVAAVHHDENDNDNVPKKAARKNVLNGRKRSQIHKRNTRLKSKKNILPIRRLNRVSTDTSKSVHMSDNEIRSN